MYPNDLTEVFDSWSVMDLKTIARAIKYLDLQDIRILTSVAILTIVWSLSAIGGMIFHGVFYGEG